MKEILAILEAVLFASGDPLSVGEIANIIEKDEAETLDLLREYGESLDSRNGGIVLQNIGGGYQLLTKPEYFHAVKKLSQVREKRLSAPTMETLSIIAFKQPITKLEIENIRGVRIERALAKLLELSLIEEKGRKEVVGHPILYGTTDIFLRTFGLNDLSDLPKLPDATDVSDGAIEEAERILGRDSEE